MSSCLKLIALATAVVFGVVPALADGGMSQWKGWEQVVTRQGCLVFWNGRTSIEYRGSGCEAGRITNGEGELLLFLPDSDEIDLRFKGRMVDGVMHGAAQMAYGNDPYWPVTLVRGCPEDWIPEGGCIPFDGRFRIAQPALGSVVAGRESISARTPATYSISAPPPAVTPLPAVSLVGRRIETPLKSGAPLQGSSNLNCVVFVPGEGSPEARSSLINRCGEEVRLNYCLQYMNGADNCSPMSVGHEATVWPLRAGAWLTMPAADTLKLWSVFACRSPTSPQWAKFENRMLTDGLCTEENLPVPRPQPGETPQVARSHDPSTWPPGWANRDCLRYQPQLGLYSVVWLRNECGRELNMHICVVPNGNGISTTTCHDRPIISAAEMIPAITRPIAKPNSYRSAHVFACDAPLIPDEIRWDGKELSGSCKAP